MDSLEAEVAETKAEVKEFRGELVRMNRTLDNQYGALKTQVSAEMERKAWMEGQRVLEQSEKRWEAIERRLAELEEAERRRRQGTGA